MQRLKIKLEEDSGCAAVVVKDTRVVRHAVLVGVQGLGTRRDVGGRNDVEEVLVRDECYGITVSTKVEQICSGHDARS